LGIAGEAQRIVEHIIQRISGAPTKDLLRDKRQQLLTRKELADA
jgi:hypothetical protein